MEVVQNALAHAWRQFALRTSPKGNSPFCGEEEDTITERLYMILDELSSNYPESIKGLSLFQTPVREGNLRNRTGTRLDCQPISHSVRFGVNWSPEAMRWQQY